MNTIAIIQRPYTIVNDTNHVSGLRLIILNDYLVERAKWASEAIKAQVSGAERKNGSVDGDEISRKGLAAELAALIQLSILFGYDFDQLLPHWENEVESGNRNTGHDIPAHWLDLTKDIEIKWITSEGIAKTDPIIYVRSLPGDATQGEKNFDPPKHDCWREYWDDNLPDSIYIGYQSPKPHHYQFIGWATKDMFHKYWYENHRAIDIRLNRNVYGYPVTGLYASQSRKQMNHKFDELIKYSKPSNPPTDHSSSNQAPE